MDFDFIMGAACTSSAIVSVVLSLCTQMFILSMIAAICVGCIVAYGLTHKKGI